MIKYVFQKLIKLYQFLIRPILPKTCRFYPSCSEYCHQAITHHGPFKGVWLGFLRIIRCHPFNPGGVDMVPIYNNERN